MDTLKQYRAKRNFRKTSEPEGRMDKPHKQSIFVIQEHHASRLHYDFRLEADGVLKSWAVPKQPSMDPSQKRLAVHVEDHPIPYANFEGTIPEGEYGAGRVYIWDHGTYDNLLAEKAIPQTMAEGMEKGRLEFKLHGTKLQGDFALIRMKGRSYQGDKDNWLLIKMKDSFARPEAEPAAPHATPKKKASAPLSKTPTRSRVRSSGTGDIVEVTHPDKLMYPDVGITKGDVFRYYQQIAPRLVPFLKDRPVTLERLPEGVGDKSLPHFWQKHTPDYYPQWIPRIELPSERGRPVIYTLVNNEETLLYLVNQGALTFHAWFSRVQDLDRPDFVLFDLDIGQATFADGVLIAQELHRYLESEGLTAVVKTSGKTGLHILVPWKQKGGYDEARAWALSVAERVVEELPEQATVDIRKARRGGRVYIDTMQNAKGHHAVAPYVLRAVPGAPVSTPLSWRELSADLNPKDFNLRTIMRRLQRQRSDPLQPLLQAMGMKSRSKTRRARQRA